MRRLARRLVERLGIERQARSVQRALGPRSYRRDLRDRDHLRALLAGTLSSDANCIDVGANVGEVLEEIVRVAPGGRHIAYEPIPELSAELARRFPRVEVREAALSNVSEQTTFRHVRSRPAMSGLREREYGGSEKVELITVRTETLDSALAEDYVPALIKIDVEGAEGLVIAGAMETIVRHRPIVVFEHGKGAAPHYGTRPARIHEMLTGRAALRIFDLDGNGPFDRNEFERIFEQGRYWNFVATP